MSPSPSPTPSEAGEKKAYTSAEPTTAKTVEARDAVDETQLDSNAAVEAQRELFVDLEEEKRLLNKLDWRIAPLVGLLYLISFLDRSNIGNAAVSGLIESLHLHGSQLNVATSIFYVTYVTFETPASVLLKKLRPSRMIPVIVIAWGLVTLFSGFMSSYAGLVVTRLILGVCEAGLFPCLTLYLTSWYRPQEQAKRLSYLFVAAAISGALGGLLATGLSQIRAGGKDGWAWLYIVEGILSIIVGFATFFLLADDPDSARYLNDREKEIMRIRQALSASYLGEQEFRWSELRRAATDPKVYISAMSQFGADVCLFGFSTFLPLIIRAMGFSAVHSQLLTIPVYAWSAAVYLALSVLSDRYDIRFAILVPLGFVTFIGYIIIISVNSIGVKYFACYLIGTGIYVTVGLNIVWLNVNQAGHYKRSMALGINQSVGNMGGIVAGQIYQSKWAPSYRTGHAVSLGAISFSILGYCCMYVWLRTQNARKARLSEEERKAKVAEGGGDIKLGDYSPNFKYRW